MIHIIKKNKMIRSIYFCLKKIILIWKIKKIRYKGEKIVFYFGLPYHTNLGDQAQTYCTLNWIKKNYPNYSILMFTSSETVNPKLNIIPILRKKIQSRDMIFFQSGYNTTDLYMLEENMHREVIVNFPNNKIIILPQTVFFVSEKEKLITSQLYSSHKNLLFFARDKVSYQNAKNMFPDIRVYLYPDIVTSLIGRYSFTNERNGILFCIRKDKESIYTNEQTESLRKDVGKYAYTDMTDTTLSIDYKYLLNHREEMINSFIDQFSKYKIIITDRYHGIIFSLISCTPVIVISSSDHKLSSGINWFSNEREFDGYVYYSDSLESVRGYVQTILNHKYEYKLPNYFKINYYDKLKDIIEKSEKSDNL